MSATQTAAPPTGKGTRHLNQGNCPGHQPPISQLVECQRLLMEEMRDAKGKPMARAAVARAIKELEYLKRDIRMQPRPRPVDVAGPLDAKRRRQPQTVGPTNDPVVLPQPAPPGEPSV